MDTKTQSTETQTMRERAIAARKKSDALWKAVREAAAEMLPKKKAYSAAATAWDEAYKSTRALEMAADAMGGKPMSPQPLDDKWYIWSIEHDGWWRENSNGYTREKCDAGMYSYGEACAIVQDANAHNRYPNEAMIKVEETK